MIDPLVKSKTPCMSVEFQNISLQVLQELNSNSFKDFPSPPLKNFVQDFGIERHGHQLPPPFYPAQPNQVVEPTPPCELEEDTTRSQTSTLFPHQLEHSIVFGGCAESDHSSPAVPLSATPNGFPQPTLSCEIISPTHSDYQGYSETSHVDIPSMTSDAISPPYYFTSGEQMYMPMEYGYNGISIQYKHPTHFVDQAPQPQFAPSTTPFNDQATQTQTPESDPFPIEHYGVSQPPLDFVDDPFPHQKCSKSLLSHLSEHFNCQEYSDCELDIQANGFNVTIMLHGLLIGQSTKLRNLIKLAPTVSQGGRTIISLQLLDKCITIPAVIAALQVCYGVTALDAFKSFSSDPTGSLRGIDMPHFEHTKIESQMDVTLAYLAAGHVLDLWNVSHCGTLNVIMFMSLETLEKVLSFSLDGLMQLKDTTKLQRLIDAIANGSLDHEDGGTYSPYSNQILQTAIEYIVTNLSEYFLLDTFAPTCSSLSPFPAVSTPNLTRSSSRSRLSFIQFGDFPSENFETPMREDTLLSSCLLSVPFILLKHILDRLDRTISQRISKPVILERERRRIANVKSWMHSGSYSACALPELSHWEESIFFDDSFFTIERRWTDL